jgi:phospholipase/carboxylesterase
MFELSGPSYLPAGGQAPRQLVVLLHGVGANGDDLIGLAPHWAQYLPDAAFVSPNAPFPFDMAPFGYQWFSLQDLSPAMMLAGVKAAAPLLDAFLDDQLAAFGLDASRLALVGFSQGTMMALYVGPRRAAACAGIVGYSGALVGADSLAGEAVSRPPVLLVHGEADPVVPVGALATAVRGLEGAGFSVEHHICRGLGHGIDPAGIQLGGRFLAQVLAARSGAGGS